MPSGLSAKLTLLVAGLFVTGSALPWIMGIRVEPCWIAVGALGGLVALLVMRNFPAALIPPVIFMGNLKSEPAAGLDLKDPTFWALAALSATILLWATRHMLQGDLGKELAIVVVGQRKAIAAFLGFAVVVALSYIHTLAPEWGAQKLTLFSSIGLLVFAAPLVLIRDERDLRHFGFSTLALSLLLVVRRIFYVSVVYPDPNNRHDFTSIGSGILLGITILLVLHYDLTKRRIPRLLILLSVPVLIVGLIASLSRSDILSLLLVLTLSFLVRRSSGGLLQSKAVRLGILAIMVGALIASVLWVRGLAGKKFTSKAGELEALAQGSDPGGSAGQRLQYYQLALTGFTEKPLLGWGVGAFAPYATGEDTREYPHNVILEVAMEEGVIGLVPLVALFAFVFAALRKTFTATRGRMGFLLWVFLFQLSVTMSTGCITDHRPLWLWCGLALAAWRMVRLGWTREAAVAPVYGRRGPAFRAPRPLQAPAFYA